jgi:hypothetical protein
MISESVPKSSITMDMAYRKDLTLQECTTFPTRADRLLAPYVTHFTWWAGRGWSTKTFLLLHLNHEVTIRGKLHRNGSSPEVGPSNCVRGLVYQRPHLKQPWPRLKQSLNTQIRWLMEQTRQVGVEGAPINPPPPYGCTLSLGLRDENSGPRVGRNESNNHIPCGGSSKPLASLFTTFNDQTMISYHTRFIYSSDSLTICTRVNN